MAFNLYEKKKSGNIFLSGVLFPCVNKTNVQLV